MVVHTIRGAFQTFSMLLIHIAIVYYNESMNDVQQKITELESKGWTLAALADELGNHWTSLSKWKAGDRSPANARSVLRSMDSLLKRKRIPKRKRYETK